MKPSTTVRWLFRCLALGLGLAQIVTGRNTIGPDARSYLEIARAILRHDWAMTINAYWSAMYPWLLAVVLGVVRPSLRSEFPVAHALAFPILVAGVASFEFYWVALLRLRELTSARLGLASPPISPTQVWVLGYSLFIWLTVGDLILPINPDLCVITIVLLQAGLLLRIEITEGAQPSLYLWFGFCLGLGYLVKAILFPMAFVFLGVMIVVSGRHVRGRIQWLVLAFLIFIALVTPEIVLLSRSKGRLTFSDTGKLALDWYTYNLPLRNWQGDPPGSGTPAHPTRKIYERPAVYEFNGPLRSSYPPWYDPSYWNEGLSPAFDLRAVAKHSFQQILELGVNFLHPKAWVIGILLIFLGSDPRDTLKGIVAYRYLVLISTVAFALYCLTLVQSRYLAPWVLLLWGAVLSGVRLKRAVAPVYLWVTVVVSLVLVTSVGYLVYGESIHGFHNDASAEYPTAEGLKGMGLQPGEKVAAIGFDNDAYWAYLARLYIAAEINTNETCFFWSESPTVQTQILEKFAQAGARVVVANTGAGVKSTSGVPIDLAKCSRPSGRWRKIDGSPNHVFFLK
jgi:hypothetical protein